MLAADTHQPGQIYGAFTGRQLVQRQYQWGITEKIRRLGHFGSQLAVQGFKVVVRKFQHRDGEHTALKLEHGGLV